MLAVLLCRIDEEKSMPIDREIQDQRRKAIVEILATLPARKQAE